MEIWESHILTKSFRRYNPKNVGIRGGILSKSIPREDDFKSSWVNSFSKAGIESMKSVDYGMKVINIFCIEGQVIYK